MTLPLTSKRRRELRAQAHALHAVVSVGQHGLTPQVLHEIDVALRAHGLIKVRVFSEDRGQREAMLAQVAEALDAAPVQHLGKLLILWRPIEEPAAKPAARAARKPAKSGRPTAAKRRAGGRETRESQATGRRARGSTAVDSARHEPESRRRRTATTKRGLQGDDARAPVARNRRGASEAAPDKRAPRGTAFRAAPKPASASRRPASSSPATARGPRGKSAPNPRRRRVG